MHVLNVSDGEDIPSGGASAKVQDSELTTRGYKNCRRVPGGERKTVFSVGGGASQ